jgi:hypothetical protein
VFAALLRRSLFVLLVQLVVQACFDWALVDQAKGDRVAYRKGRHPLQMLKNALVRRPRSLTQVVLKTHRQSVPSDAFCEPRDE